MSIFLVKLSEWYPFGDENFEYANIMVKAIRCPACRSKMRYKAAIGHHSIPWGYGDIFCGWKCADSRKIAKPDKRYERRLKRNMARQERFFLPITMR